MTTHALILAGHGSHISPQTAGLVWHHVDGIRQMGVFDEVTAAFWKEAPSFHTVFNSLTAEDITVVPLFTSQGYFTQTVIPAEMGLTGSLTQRGGKTIRYTKTLSEHPYLSGVVADRIEAAVAQIGAPPDQCAIAIIGHSTRRNPESRKATEAQAETIRARGTFAEVHAVYLDDSPAIRDIYSMTHAPILIAVPYFLALGSHTTIDVPTELGLAVGEDHGTVQGRDVFYTQPVGTDDALQNVILQLAREAGATLHDPPLEVSAYSGFPRAGRITLPEGEYEQKIIGQLLIRANRLVPTEYYRARGKFSNPYPALLREIVRESTGWEFYFNTIVFRPLATSDDLPLTWDFRLDKDNPTDHAHAIIETIYPGLLGDRAVMNAASDISQSITPLPDLIARQTGLYANLATLSAEQVDQTVQNVCGHCIRHPTWHDPSVQSDTPCPEACNFWLSAALEMQTSR